MIGEFGMTISTRSASERERDADDLDVLALVDRCDHAARRDVAVAEMLVAMRVAHRTAAAGAGDDAGDIEARPF